MCITEEKLVEAYGNSNPHERFLLIYKNYSVFPQLVDCYETGLFNRILLKWNTTGGRRMTMIWALGFRQAISAILQSAKLYRQIQKADGKITELKKLIEDKENHSDDAERIANLKYSVLVKARETVPVKVYKIDLNVANSSYKRWEDTLTQSSGAEKFVVFFSVVLTLMNYTRSTSGIVSKEAKSVLILDNPFGKITSAHLLKPMFDIAKHFNVQLICLSDINKSDVTSCFECVIKLVIKQQALSNFEIMTHEDNERIEHGYYKIMNGQMSLF